MIALVCYTILRAYIKYYSLYEGTPHTPKCFIVIYYILYVKK